MRDTAKQRVVKRLARWSYALGLALQRWSARRSGVRPFELVGACVACGSCCERPSLQVGLLIWHLPLLQRWFVWWQHTINGLDLIETVRADRMLLFRCSHFDPVSRRCDSYDTRPGMCRDYPRRLLYQLAPDFFTRCGYHARAANAAALLVELERQQLPPEKLAELKRRLYLE